jgi:hypothetical protein
MRPASDEPGLVLRVFDPIGERAGLLAALAAVESPWLGVLFAAERSLLRRLERLLVEVAANWQRPVIGGDRGRGAARCDGVVARRAGAADRGGMVRGARGRGRADGSGSASRSGS